MTPNLHKFKMAAIQIQNFIYQVSHDQRPGLQFICGEGYLFYWVMSLTYLLTYLNVCRPVERNDV